MTISFSIWHSLRFSRNIRKKEKDYWRTKVSILINKDKSEVFFGLFQRPFKLNFNRQKKSEKELQAIEACLHMHTSLKNSPTSVPGYDFI